VPETRYGDEGHRFKRETVTGSSENVEFTLPGAHGEVLFEDDALGSCAGGAVSSGAGTFGDVGSGGGGELDVGLGRTSGEGAARARGCIATTRNNTWVKNAKSL
jgi:hypothetical protein